MESEGAEHVYAYLPVFVFNAKSLCFLFLCVLCFCSIATWGWDSSNPQPRAQATSRHDERRPLRCLSRSSIYAKLSSLCNYLASEQLAQSCQVICMLTRRQRRTVHKSQVTIAMVYIFIAKPILYISLLISLCKAETNLRADSTPAQNRAQKSSHHRYHLHIHT